MKSRRLPQAEFLWILFLCAALFRIECVHAQVVKDNDFVDGDWSATVVSVSGNTTHSAGQMLQGGSLDSSYRNMTHNMAGIGSITVFHEYLGSSFDPAAGGVFVSISYSESRVNLAPAFPGAAIGGRPAIRQGTIVYTAELDDFANTKWANVELSLLGETDFSDGASHPDFSPSGAPIQFGYTRSNTLASGFDTEHGIDNWRFEICVEGDTDCDGVADVTDNCTIAQNPDQRDKDGDGIGNACDADISQDCRVNFLDSMLMPPTFFVGPCSMNWNSDADLNEDGIVNFPDLELMRNNFFLNYKVDNPSLAFNNCTDSDGDLVADVDDNCPHLNNPGQRDTDGDGIGNLCDPDLDNNCAVDAVDDALIQAAMGSMPGSPNWNPNADFDGDDDVDNDDALVWDDFAGGPPGPGGIPNGCGPPDTDGDGVLDTEDNCTLLSNPDQRDTDNDGFGNVCDPDLDNDCLVGFLDLNIISAAQGSTSCNSGLNWNPDADFDGDDDVDGEDAAVWDVFAFGPPGPSLVRCPTEWPGSSDFPSAKREGHNATIKPFFQP